MENNDHETRAYSSEISLCSDNNFGRSSDPTNVTREKLNTRLIESIQAGAITYMRSLIATGANPNATCRLDHVSACHIASIHDNDALDLLISSGADSSRFDRHGTTPLHLAAWAGKAKQIASLLNFPEALRKSVVDHVALSPETVAEVTRHSLPVHKLINVPCRRNVESTLPGDWSDGMEHNCYSIREMLPVFEQEWTALHAASARAQHHCVQLLLAAGADQSAQDHLCRTPLDVAGYAHYMGHKIDVNSFKETVDVLLKAGGKLFKFCVYQSLSKPNENKTRVNKVQKTLKLLLKVGGRFRRYHHSSTLLDTPLHTAVELGSEAAVKLLLQGGISATMWNSRGLTAMHVCVEKRNKKLLQLLASHKSSNEGSDLPSIDVVDRLGYTVLCSAVVAEWLDGVRIALSAGATNMKATRSYFKCDETTVLHLAACLGSKDILNHLLNFYNHDEREKHINAPDEFNGPPLYYAVEHDHYDCASLLIIRGAKVNIKHRVRHITLLNLAVSKNNAKMVEMIIRHDKETVHAVDGAGRSPLYEACYHGNKEIIALLLRNGADLSGCESENERKLVPIEMLMLNVSKPTKFLQEIFDSNIISLCLEAEDKVFVDFRVLLPRCGTKKMKVIQALLDTGNRYDQQSLLLHPLVESFLYLQWRSLLPFFYIILALHVCFVVSLNVFALSLFWCKDKKIEPVPNIFRSSAWIYIIYLTAFLLTLQEIIVIRMKTMRFHLSTEASVKCLSTIFAVVLPQVVSWDSKSNPEWVRLFGSAALLLTWVRVMYLLSRLPDYGYYVLMYGKVATKVFKILVSLGFPIIGFCVSFMIQFHAEPPFEGPWSSLLTTMVMMTSELGYNEIINKKSVEIRILFVFFLIFVSIILMNLLVGVAVNDVNTLEIIGNRNRLKKQAQFIKSFEDTGCYNFIKRLLVRWLDDKIFKNYISLHSLQNYGLPTRLIEAILQNAQLQKWDEKQSMESFQTKLDEIHEIILNKDRERRFAAAKSKMPNNEVKVLVSQVLEEIVKLRTDMELIKNRIGKNSRFSRST